MGGLVDGQALVVVVVERVEGVGIVGDHLEQGVGLIGRENGLVLNGAPQHAHQLAQLANLLFVDALVDGIAFDEKTF